MFRVITKSYFDEPEKNETFSTAKELKDKYQYIHRKDFKKMRNGGTVVWDQFAEAIYFTEEVDKDVS